MSTQYASAALRASDGPWPDDAIAAIWRTARAVLGQVGVRVDSPAAVDALLGVGCIEGRRGRILVPSPVVEEALARCPSSFLLAARDAVRSIRIDALPGEIYVHNCGELPLIRDSRTGNNRPATLRDQAQAARIMQHGRYPDTIGSLVWPQDVPSMLQPLYSYLAIAAETDKHIGGPCVEHAWQVRYLTAMAEALIGDRPENEYPIDLAFSPTSPLWIDRDAAESLMEAALLGAVVEVLPSPAAGTTAPASLAAALAQQDAEALAGVVLAQAAAPGTPVYYGPRLSPVNPRTGKTLRGASGTSAASVAATLLARRHGLACDCYGPSTCATTLDMQAGWEHGINATVGALAYPRLMSGVGAQEGASTCLELLVIDDQILTETLDALSPRPWDEDALGAEVIAEGVLSSTGFLGMKHTRRYMHSALTPSIVSYRGEPVHLQRDSDIVDRASERVDRLLSRSPKGLPTEVEREFCRLIDEAAAEIGLREWPDPRTVCEWSIDSC